MTKELRKLVSEEIYVKDREISSYPLEVELNELELDDIIKTLSQIKKEYSTKYSSILLSRTYNEYVLHFIGTRPETDEEFTARTVNEKTRELDNLNHQRAEYERLSKLFGNLK